MEFLGLTYTVNSMPELDSGFVPLAAVLDAHAGVAREPFAIALIDGDACTVYETAVSGQPQHRAADEYILERLLKFLLWAKAGNRVQLCGNEQLAQAVAAQYVHKGRRGFDTDFLARAYRSPLTAECLPYSKKPQPCTGAVKAGGQLSGCRIGFDAGGSDRKVSAVIDGRVVYSEEVLWFPKENADPAYHYGGIVKALRTAASKMPRVDAIGVSSAGIYIRNECRAASLFIKVSEEDFDAKVRDIYVRAAAEVAPGAPLVVANDGDVTALAGAMELGRGGVLGIAMGTSEAAGYIDVDGKVTGWLNELAFAPVDANPAGAVDEWSGDAGCGVMYHSQDAVIRLCPAAGIELTEQTKAGMLCQVQMLANGGDARALRLYRSLGVYLGHSLGLYSRFYDIRDVLLLGRVMSGAGGDVLLEEAKRVLALDYPACNFVPQLPDEKSRRVGQSVAAASL